MGLKKIQRIFWMNICIFSLFYTLLITRPTIPYILINPYFNYRDFTNNHYRINQQQFINFIQDKLEHKDCFIMKNDYPYKVNAQHYVIWLKNQSIDQFKCLNNSFPSVTEYKLQENPWWLKSIPQIRHIHLFLPNK